MIKLLYTFGYHHATDDTLRHYQEFFDAQTKRLREKYGNSSYGLSIEFSTTRPSGFIVSVTAPTFAEADRIGRVVMKECRAVTARQRRHLFAFRPEEVRRVMLSHLAARPDRDFVIEEIAKATNIKLATAREHLAALCKSGAVIGLPTRIGKRKTYRIAPAAAPQTD